MQVCLLEMLKCLPVVVETATLPWDAPSMKNSSALPSNVKTAWCHLFPSACKYTKRYLLNNKAETVQVDISLLFTLKHEFKHDSHSLQQQLKSILYKTNPDCRVGGGPVDELGLRVVEHRQQTSAGLRLALGADEGVAVIRTDASGDETLTFGGRSDTLEPQAPGEGAELVRAKERDLDPGGAVEVAGVLDDPAGDDADVAVADPVSILGAVVVEVDAHNPVAGCCRINKTRKYL